MAHQLKDREIFAVGVWNDMEFSSDDLDDIIANFDKLKDTHKVPLKFGHDADHNDGQPAIGWIDRVFRQGDKLFADFVNMPRTVFEAIKERLYRTVSVELLFNVDSDGNKFNHVLDAVALLGADHPAVNSLADLDLLMAKRTAFTGGHRLVFETIAGSTKMKKDDGMDAKEVQALIDKANAPIVEANAKLTKENDELKAANAKFTTDKADDEKKANEDAVKLARKTVTDTLDAAVKSKAMTPAFRENYEKQIGVANDEIVLTIDVEAIKGMFSVKEPDGQTGLHKDGTGDEGDPETELMALTRKNQQTNGKDFSASFALTCEANPKLHKAYLDSNGDA
jgi:hypothetical protein